MSDNFLDQEAEEFLRELRIQPGVDGQGSKARDLLRLSNGVGGRQGQSGLQLTHLAGALEPLREKMEHGGVDIVDRMP